MQQENWLKVCQLLLVIVQRHKHGPLKLPSAKGQTTVLRGHFAELPLGRYDYLVVRSINIHDIYILTHY